MKTWSLASRAVSPQADAGCKTIGVYRSERLGHATIGITLDTYSHAVPAMHEGAANKIAALIE